MPNDSLIAIFARRALGELQSQEIVDWAVQELVAGRDTPELCVLAGMSPPFYYSEVGEQFFKALAELSIVPPDKETCLRLYARQIAQALLDGSLSAPDTCYQIYPIWQDTYEDDYMVWAQLRWAWSDLIGGFESYEYDSPDLTLANFDDYARMEARKFLTETKFVSGP